ncbi:MAG: AMP-binding protein [Anaerolineaceae bacterium]
MEKNDDRDRPWLARYDKEVQQHLAYPSVPLYDFLQTSARKYPQKACTIFNGLTISYEEIWRLSSLLANQLVQLGVKKGGRVGLALVNSPSFVVAFYGILMAGGVVVAINPLYLESEFAFMLNNAGVEVIIGQTDNLTIIEKISIITKMRVAIISDIKKDGEALANGLEACGRVEDSFLSHPEGGIKVMPFLEILRKESSGQILPVIDPSSDAAVFQYSGGTTGTPKAAIGLHRNLAANTLQFRNWLWSLKDGKETILAAIPLYHVYGMVIGLSVGVMLGASLLLEDNLRNLDQLLDDVELHRPGLFPCVPNLFSGILQKIKTSDRRYDLSSLRICISGSAPLLPAVKESFEKLTGGKVLEGYGLSEAPTATHCNPLGGQNKTGSIGLPLPDVDCKLIPYLEEDFGKAGANTGELLIRGPQVMAGYHNAGADDESILAGGWLHTGDIASMDEDGYFYIQGRKKELIKVGGLQVWPAEIEEIISQHPVVREVCVAGVPGPEKSEIVKAWVVLKEGGLATEQDIRQWVRQRLVGYKVPGLIEFRETLPRTAVGKPLRRELVREYIENLKNQVGRDS